MSPPAPSRQPDGRPQVTRLPAPRRLVHDPEAPLPEEPRRLTLLGAAIAVIVAVIVGGIVFVGSHALSTTYQATSDFRVTVPNQNGISDPTVTGENDTASQDAELVKAAPVLNAAATALHVPASELSGRISGATVNDENIVQITANAPTAGQANELARATGAAAVAYIQQLDARQGDSDYAEGSGRLSQISAEIAADTARLRRDSKAQAAIDNQTIQQLTNDKAEAEIQLNSNVTDGETSLQQIPAGDNASQTAPKPKEYALIGALAALVVALRVVYVLRVGMGRRRPVNG